MKLYKIYMYILKSYVAKLLSAFVNAVWSSAHCFVQLFKCMPDSMELKILTGTLGALIGENPYGSE